MWEIPWVCQWDWKLGSLLGKLLEIQWEYQ